MPKRRRVSAALKRRHKKAVTNAVKMKVKYNMSYNQLRDLLKMYKMKKKPK